MPPWLKASMLVFGSLLPVCYAQERLRLFRSENPVALDGLLTEPCWRQAQAVSTFLQRDPREGEPATEKTEVRVVLHQKTLYIGIVAYDSQPDLIVAKEMRRDGATQWLAALLYLGAGSGLAVRAGIWRANEMAEAR